MKLTVKQLAVFLILGLFSLSVIYPDIAMAIELKKPSFVNDVDADDLEKAGDEISKWIFAFMAVIVGISSVRPGYLYISGKGEEATEKAKDIIIGVIVAVVLGGVAFAVAKQVGG